MTARAAEAGPAPTDSKRIAATLITTVSLQVLGIISGGLAARLLGVHNRGILAAVLLWPSIVSYLGDLGGPLAYTYLAAKKPERLPSLMGNAFMLAAFQSLILAVVGVPIVMLGLHSYGPAIGLSIAFLLAYLPLNLLTRYLNSINQGLGRFRSFNGVRLTVQVTYTVGVVALFILGLHEVRAVIAITLISNLVALAVAVRLWRYIPRPRADRKLIWETFRYGLRGHVGNLTLVDAMQLDLIAVTLLLGARNAGLYAVAISAAMVVRAQGAALGMVLLPSVAASRTIDAQRASVARTFKLALILHVATAGVVILAAGVLVPMIYGKGFEPAIGLVRILSIAMVAASLRQVLGDSLRGAGRPLAGTLVEVSAWPVAFLGLALLVPMLGTTGAALTMVAAYLTALFVAVSLTLNPGMIWSDMFLPTREDFRFAVGVARGMIPAARMRPSFRRESGR